MYILEINGKKFLLFLFYNLGAYIRDKGLDLKLFLVR